MESSFPHFLGFRNLNKSEESADKNETENENKKISFIFETSQDADASEKNKTLLMHVFRSR